jgi:hypothetical protein
LWVGPGAYPKAEYLKGVGFALPANIRLDKKGLPGTNTLAYYKTVNYGQKSFITLDPEELISMKKCFKKCVPGLEVEDEVKHLGPML